jgi:protease I
MDHPNSTVAVLVENFYEDLELWYPVLRLREAGAKVTIVGPEAGKTYTSKHGYPAKSEAAAGDVKGSDFDAVIVPGGYAPDHMRRHKPMVELVRDAATSGRIVAAICHAGWMLASANVIRGKTMTCFFAIKDDMVNAGATVVDREVVRDGNLITSRTPADLPAFCRAIVEALAEARAGEQVGGAKR